MNTKMSSRGKKVLVAIAGIVLLSLIGNASDKSENPAEAKQDWSTAFIYPDKWETMTCEQLRTRWDEAQLDLSNYVSGIYRSSWDMDMAQRIIDREPTRDRAHRLMRSLDDRIVSTCF